jgi:hypothetical protein
MEDKQSDANSEKQIAIRMYKHEGRIPGLGTIIDYQNPLKKYGKRYSRGDRPTAFDEKNGVLRLLELKVPNSTEPCCAVCLSVYYLRLVERKRLFRTSNCGKQKNIPSIHRSLLSVYICRNSNGENGASTKKMRKIVRNWGSCWSCWRLYPCHWGKQAPYSAYELELWDSNHRGEPNGGSIIRSSLWFDRILWCRFRMEEIDPVAPR